MNRQALLAGAVALLMVAPAFAADKAAYDAALAAAKKEREAAAALGGEWRDIGKFLKKADAAAAKGDFATAVKLANKAEFQAKAGQEQAKTEAGVGNASYLY